VRPGALGADSTSAAGAGVVSALPDWIKGEPLRRLESADTPDELAEARRGLARAVIGRIPTAMFLLLPVFAGLLKLLYFSGGGLRRPRRRTPRRARAARRRQRRLWRRVIRAFWSAAPRRLRVRRVATNRRLLGAKRTRYLSEHLVFALHVHAFAFTVFLAILLLNSAGESPLVSRATLFLGWSVPAYFLLAQKHVYAQRWGKTLFKALVLGVSYCVALVFGGLLALALAATMG
jgi:hypothetical protein